jgi:hypothetical protein
MEYNYHCGASVGGLTCKITRGSFFAATRGGLTVSLSDADTEVDEPLDTACVCVPLPG